MSSVKYADSVYSFRAQTSFVGEFIGHAPDAATLAQIESDLSDAATAYYQRRYNDAIDYYKKAGLLIHRHLDTLVSTISPGAYDTVSHDVRLFDPILSVASGFMNVLPIPTPAPVRPSITVDPKVFGNPAIAQTGIRSTTLNSRTAQSAIADMQAASHFRDLGQVATAQALETRAQQTDANTAALFKVPTAGSHGTTVPSPVAGVGSRMTSPIMMAVTPRLGLGSNLVATPRLATIGTLPTNLSSGVLEGRTLGIMSNGTVTQISWTAGQTPDINKMKSAVYTSRITASSVLGDLLLHPQQPSDIALSLPHHYYYTIPLGIAEALHALGDYVNAETHYIQAAGYQYLNQAVEAPYLWLRIATLYLDWGNTLFRAGETADALSKYEQVLMPDDSAPTASQLYTLTALKPGTDAAHTIIANLNAFVNTPSSPSLPAVNPVLVATIIEVHQQIIKINAGLDFWGFWTPSVPIWTFDYLQSVAVNFTQLATNAERDFINYQDRADQAALTRQQIVQQVSQAYAEVQAAQLQAHAAALEVQVYKDGMALAQQRAADAQKKAHDYAAKSWDSIIFQACSTQVSGGDDGDPNYLNKLASRLLSGRGATDESRATLAAADQLAGARANRDYEIGALQRQASELQAATKQAQSEQVAASARAAAANAAVAVASLRATAAQQTLDAFDSQFFTSDVWHRMGDVMYRLYRRYLSMALYTARVMQQAYNFETDQSLHFIKADYSTNEVKGLLAAEALMADIQSFTYDLITSSAGKPQPVHQTISLAQNYSYLFETKFRKTGVMEFETRIDDFDTYYPGTYSGRIEAVEVEVDGIVPVSGISGTLTNSGISFYRIPRSSWPTPSSSGLKYRVQSKETLVLSDYQVRQDALLISSDQRMLRIFQGAGVASSWRLELPKAINDIDYGALTDVRITFYYKARFDPVLHDLVLAQLAAHPGVNTRQRAIPLRWFYPDAFFHFQDTGTLSITLKAVDFRRNESKPVLTNIGLLVATDGTVAPNGLNVSLATPTHTAILGTTDATGLISSGGASPWTPLGTGTSVGDYAITLATANNPTLVHNGKLDLTHIVNIVLILEYTFTPRS